jgi:hypothetical protein
MEDIIEFTLNMKIFGYIVFNKFELIMSHQMSDIFYILFLNQIIHTDDMMAKMNEKIAEMGTKKTRSACDECPLHSSLLLLHSSFRSREGFSLKIY